MTDPGNITDLKPFEELPEDRKKREAYEKELKDSQALIDEQVAKAVKEHPELVSTRERNKKLEEERIREWRDKYDDYY